MAAIGMSLLWVSYTAGLYGYSLVRGYDNTLASLVNPVRTGKWSTTVYTGTGIFPPAPPSPAAGEGGAGAGEGPGGPVLLRKRRKGR